MLNENDKYCFRYVCDKYPKCMRARGKGCCIDSDYELKIVKDDECCDKNGYAMFIENA